MNVFLLPSQTALGQPSFDFFSLDHQTTTVGFDQRTRMGRDSV